MSVTSKFLDSNLSLIDGGRAVKYKLDFRKMHPTYFDPEGILIFCGPRAPEKLYLQCAISGRSWITIQPASFAQIR